MDCPQKEKGRKRGGVPSTVGLLQIPARASSARLRIHSTCCHRARRDRWILVSSTSIPARWERTKRVVCGRAVRYDLSRGDVSGLRSCVLGWKDGRGRRAGRWESMGKYISVVLYSSRSPAQIVIALTPRSITGVGGSGCLGQRELGRGRHASRRCVMPLGHLRCPKRPLTASEPEA